MNGLVAISGSSAVRYQFVSYQREKDGDAKHKKGGIDSARLPAKIQEAIHDGLETAVICREILMHHLLDIQFCSLLL
jgi:hypothetical protein